MSNTFILNDIYKSVYYQNIIVILNDSKQHNKVSLFNHYVMGLDNY